MRAAEVRARVAALVRTHRVKRPVQVGAHEGEEVPGLLAAGVERLTLVEPIPGLAAKLRGRWVHEPRVQVVEAACSDRAGSAALRVMARTNMSTLAAPAVGEVTSVLVVPTRRLDDICPDADCAIVDVQGHEVPVLDGAPWESLRLVIVETLHGVDDPAMAPPHDEVVAYMRARGFAEVAAFGRSYDFIQRWAYGVHSSTGGEVRDVVFART